MTTTRPRRRRTLALVLAAVAALVLAACETTQQDYLYRAIQVNTARSAAGVRALTGDQALTGRADAWAQQMRDDWVRAGCPTGDLAARGILRHSSLSSQYGSVPGWTILGENIGAVPLYATRGDSLDALQASYLASAKHRETMLDGRYSRGGFAVVWGPTAGHKAYGLCPNTPVNSYAFSTDVFANP